MGPLEGNVAEHAESILHDLCHAATLGLPMRYGRCYGLQNRIDDFVEELPRDKQDMNEVETIAAESLVVERLGIEVSWETLIYLGSRNVSPSGHSFSTRVKMALKKPRVHEAAETVVRFVQRGRA